MDQNLKMIENVVAYIDCSLTENLDLDSLAREFHYSKYHLHRMFTAIVGLPLHRYIQRRRLTEAARSLVFTDTSILEIALLAGYDTQRSFTVGFYAMFKHSPQAFRRRKRFLPLQLKFDVNGREQLRGDRILNVKTVESAEITLVGFCKSTKRGFYVIGQCWRKLHLQKHKILNRTDRDFLIGVNDYSAHPFYEEKQPCFDYYAGAQVSTADAVPNGMTVKRLAPSKYVVFCLRGNNQDSMQPVVEYIYQQWLPQSTCVFNENSMLDFVKYGEHTDENGESEIEYWVPIL